MSRRLKRFLMTVLIGFAVLIGGLCLLFCVFVYNPLEGSWETMGTLAPRSVSFFFTKRDLGAELRALPDRDGFQNLRDSEAIHSLLGSPEFLTFDQKYAIEENFARFQQFDEAFPIDLLSEVLGTEIGIAGSPLGTNLSEWDIIFYTRVGWKIRAMFELAGNSRVQEMLPMDAGVSLENVDGGKFKKVSIVQAGKTKSVFVGRVKDVIVATTKIDLMQEVMDLGDGGVGTSLVYDREYRDPVELVMGDTEVSEEEVDPAGLYLNLSEVRRLYGVDEMLESGRAGTTTRIATDMLGLQTMDRFYGVFRPETPTVVEGTIELNEDKGETNRRRILTTDGLPISEIEEKLGSLLPTRTFFFVFLRCGVRDLFELITTSFSAADRRLIDDALKKIPEINDLEDFLGKTSSHFTDEIAAALSRKDLSALKGAQRFNPKPAMTIFLETLDAQALTDYLAILERDEFAVSGIEKSDLQGVTVTAGTSKIDGSEMAYAIVGNKFILSTSRDFLEEVILISAGQMQGLAGSPEFQVTMKELGDKATMLFYLNSGEALGWLGDFSQKLASDLHFMSPDDWIRFRGLMRQELVQQNPSLRGQQLESAIDQRASEKQAEIDQVDIPQTVENLRRYADWARLVSSMGGAISYQGESARVKSLVRYLGATP